MCSAAPRAHTLSPDEEKTRSSTERPTLSSLLLTLVCQWTLVGARSRTLRASFDPMSARGSIRSSFSDEVEVQRQTCSKSHGTWVVSTKLLLCFLALDSGR